MEIARTRLTCPECGQELSRAGDDAPWCAACEWNLFGPASRLATRWDRALFTEFLRQRPTKPPRTPLGVALVIVSVLLGLVPFGLLGWGAWLLATGSWLVGSLLLVLAFLLRPRLGRLPGKNYRLRREQAPTLFGLIDRVAAAAGTPVPEIVTISSEYNASTYRAGFRRTTGLDIGTFLFATLSPQQRVALLAHELGHQVNGDPARLLLVQPALTTFGTLANMFGAYENIREVVFGGKSMVPLRFLMFVIGQVFLVVQVALSVLAFRDHQRAEYLADGVAVDVAGSAATASLMDRLALGSQIIRLLAYRANTKGPADWPALVADFHAARQEQIGAYRQLTLRESTLWDSHPPSGLRARIVEAWPQQAPAFVLSEQESARIDGELARWYRLAHQRLLD
ncbi:M48 family metalloprotease [Lentzea nigeriaca]|uniref:M48 family metalloprotease n=1 Tax=Lentzea nigeriaca TaxID=1128665 RepID=UPI00195AF474|nr:M48 family metallopeptidase [Lentzea nigeriaca]MBM7859285.1 Zn-dependent protease with chaperone function [Lentzea nigeriaca]